MKQLNDQYFNYRQTPVDYDGVAKPSIKGNTLVWNQLVQNGNFASTSNWFATRGTISVSSNVLSYTSTEIGNGGIQNRLNQDISFVANHKYLFTVDVNPAHSTTFNYWLTGGGTVCEVISKSVITGWQTVSAIYKPTANLVQIRFGCVETNDVYTVGDVDKYRNVNIFDLTQMGLDTLTASEFTSLFPLSYYAYDSGSLLNFNGTGIKITGKNLCPKLTSITYRGVTFTTQDDGTVIANGTATGGDATVGISLQNFLSGNYYFSGSPDGGSNDKWNAFIWDATANARAKQWDKTTNVINSINSTTRYQVYIDQNRSYLYQLRVMNGTTADNLVFKPMITFSDAEFSYEPYTTSTTSLPVSTYFPTGMKSAGSVYDELSDKAITRVGSVDLGSLTWSYWSERNLFYADISDVVIKIDNLNGVCSAYPLTTTILANMEDKTLRFGNTEKRIYVRDDSYNGNATNFKAGVNGDYLNYELETYTEQSAEDIYYNFYVNGTEQLLPVNTDAPSTSPLLADIIYYNLIESEVPYRVFWMINSKGERWDFTEREFKSFLNNPQGLGFSKTFSVNRYGNVQNLTDITDNFPQPNGEVLFYDSSNSTRYDKYNNFVKFLSYEPITLYYKIPVSFFSRIPNTYSLECVVGTLSKTESKTDHMLTCSINYNALSFYKGEEVEVSGTGTSYTINNDSDFPIGFEITITGSPVNPYFTLTQDGEMYGEAKFGDSTAFSSIYVNSNDGEQNVELQQGGSVLPNPLSYQDLSISNGSIYVTFVKLARGESTLTIGKDSGSITGVDIKFTPIYRSV